MSGIAELMYKKTSGLQDKEIEMKERLQKYHEATSQLQYDEKSGTFGYLPGSDLALRGQFNQAQGDVFNQLLGELQMVKQEVQQVQNTNLIGKQSNAVYDAITGQDFETLNQLIGTDERTGQMFQKLGVQAVHKFDPSNRLHVEALRQSGANPNVVEKLLSGQIPQEQMDLISKAWPIVQGPDNKLSLASLPEFIGMTKMDNQMGSAERGRQIRDFIARSYNALQGLTDDDVDNRINAGAIKNMSGTIENEASALKLEDMQNFLANNPNATLADYMSTISSKKYNSLSALEKEAEYIRREFGDDAAEAYINKKITRPDNTPATIKTEQYKVDNLNAIKQESGVENMYDVDYGKLSPDNKTRFDLMVQDDTKRIKPEELDALTTLEASASKLNAEDLSKTTGIVDATFHSIFDHLGLDLPDEVLTQSANYNLIKNSIVRAAMGTAVTGTEMERMKAQLGTEFRADKTVRVKMAETLDNLAAKYEKYKATAPALYARVMKDKVTNMQDMSNYLKDPEGKAKPVKGDKPANTQVTQPTQKKVTFKVGQEVNGYQFLGGDDTNPKNWKKVK